MLQAVTEKRCNSLRANEMQRFDRRQNIIERRSQQSTIELRSKALILRMEMQTKVMRIGTKLREESDQKLMVTPPRTDRADWTK